MSDPERPVDASDEYDDEYDDEEGPRNPFDNPFFLPVLLGGLSIWFGYDGWFNTDPEMMEHQTFNRVGFFVLVVLGVWFTWRAVQERRAEVETGREDAGHDRPPPIG